MRLTYASLVLAASVFACGPPVAACTPEDGLGPEPAQLCSSQVQAEFYQKASTAVGHDLDTFAWAPQVMLMMPEDDHYNDGPHGAYYDVLGGIIYINPTSTHEDLFVLYGIFLWLNDFATLESQTLIEMKSEFRPLGE